jgi:phenylpyruvate tautomerase PptA (4-oxalocrotonate tautomerase family)
MVHYILIFCIIVPCDPLPVNIREKEANMPFTRISLLKGKSPDYIAALSESLHRAMVETFNVPPADRFHIIHQHDQGELIFDRNYLAGPRSDDFVLIAITAGKPRTAEARAAFFKRAVELLGQSPGLRPEDVMIVVNTTAPDEWSFGNGGQQMLEPGWEIRAMETAP